MRSKETFSKRSWKSKENSSLLSSKKFQNEYVNKLDINFLKRAFLNRPILRQTKLCHHPSRPTTTHHNPPRRATSQNISTSTHHQPKYIHHDPLPPTTIHHYPPPAKIYPPLPTTTHHPPPAKIYPPPPTTGQKYIHHHLSLPKKWNTTPQKRKYIHILPPFDIALTVSFSSKCNILSVTEILCDKVLIRWFFKFQISTPFYDI